MANQLAYLAAVAPFSDVADAQWHGSTCQTKSDAVGLFEVQESLEPLHKEGPDPSAKKRSTLTFTSPPLDPRADTDPITASWPLLDGSKMEDTLAAPPLSASAPSFSSTLEPTTEARKTALRPLSALTPSVASGASEPTEATDSHVPQGKNASIDAAETTPSPTARPEPETGTEYSTVAFSVVSGTFLTATSDGAKVYQAVVLSQCTLLLLLLSMLSLL